MFKTHFLLLLALSTCASAFAPKTLAPVFATYAHMQTALAADDFAAAKEAVNKLKAALANVDEKQLEGEVKTTWAAQQKPLAAAAGSAQAAVDIKVMRQHFEPISMAMIALFDVTDPGGYLRMRCPMAFDNKGADWLQKGKTVNNPYFGSRMLRCGYQVRPD